MTPQRFQQIREEMGLSRRELAALLGYSNPEQDYNIISRLERGRRDISPICGRLMLLVFDYWKANGKPPDFNDWRSV